MTLKKHKTIIYLLLLSMAAMPVASAFASISSLITPVENSVDAGPAGENIQSGVQHDSSQHSSSHDMSDHVAKASDHCDTSKANCNQCDDCSHCINLVGSSYLKQLPLLDHHIISNFSDLYRSVDQALFLRPPIRS